MIIEDKKSSNHQSPPLCEFAGTPFADCFCQNINGNSIPKIARFCMEENSACPIYKKGQTGKSIELDQLDV